MANYQPSLEERKLRLFEDVCSSCGDGGEGGDSAASAMGGDDSSSEGTDTLMRTLKMLSDKKKGKKKKPVTEGTKKELPITKMIMKASNLEFRDDPDKEKRMKLLDRARKIRSEIK